MFTREIKFNFKSFLIWTLILLGIFLVVFAVYPSIIHGEKAYMIEDMMKLFPEELLKAFNMDLSSIDTVFGWLKSEGFTFVLLITGCYSGILGSTILLKEENDKTIEYLHSLPVTRKRIVFEKYMSGIVYIVSMILLLCIFNYIGLLCSGQFDQKLFFLLSFTPLFSSVVIYSICMFLSTFTHKSKKMLGISLGIVFVSYVLQMLSSLSDSVSFLRYFSVFTLADIRNVITGISYHPLLIALSIGFCILLYGLITIRYERKEML